ncbi:hypothetical protein [Actinomycetospora lemnae]|uniref:Glycosyltransferase RgtA/B/C/D-like domain-containing protein n=1 Tax=Actinomycetospora lemnae TaxID=3019891 RepID=A0ABT5SXS2_9PSEU|nr:hypothetical protein [Actinomycetospora sp. DW7H6]MDD7966946.1 hypothetical protein [Actinomycetospora sp. DW7H6]
MTPRRAAPTPWGRADLVVAVVLYAAAAAWFLWLAAGASAQGVITGEEASVSHRDAMALAVRWQPSIWSTNAAGQLFYWAAGHLDPDYGLLYARKWKAVATALLAPLLYATARRRLGCGRPSAVLAGVVGVVVPAVSLLAWVGIETPLDVVAGLAALLVVTSRTRWWWLGLVLAGVAVSLYTAALASAAAVVVVALVRAVRAPLAFLVGAAGGALVVLAPLAWWRNGGIVVTGGGRAGPQPAAAGENLRDLAGHALDSGSSYYWFADLPALGAPWIAAVLAGAALVGTAARSGQLWPWVLAGLLAVGLYAVASGVPGTRRVLLVATVLGLAAAVGVDVLTGFGGRAVPVVVPAVVPLLVLVVVATPMTTATTAWRAEVAAGRPALPIDWPFPVDPGGDQASTLARLADDLRAGRTTPRAVGDGWGGTRTLAMIFMLDERAGRAPALGPGDVLAYYRVSEDCPPLDGPACGVSASPAPAPGG